MITVTLTDRQAMLVGNITQHVLSKVTEHMLSGSAFYVSELQADPQLATDVTHAMQAWTADAKAVIRKITSAPVRPDVPDPATAGEQPSDERDTDNE